MYVLFISSAVDIAWLDVKGLSSGWLYSSFLSDVSYAFSIINVIGKIFLILFLIITYRNWRDDSITYFQTLNSEPLEFEQPVISGGH